MTDRSNGMRPLAVLLLATLLATQGCASRTSPPATGPTPTPPDVLDYPVGWVQEGIASWYGHPFHGQPTASGTIYDMDGWTAAHQELPLGTFILVENQDTGREIRLMVNDRGPFVKGRVLDVSRAAARSLGMIGPGTARVKITILRSADAVTSRGGCVILQVGYFRDPERVAAVVDRVEQAGYDAILSPYDGGHRIETGPFRNIVDADQARTRLGGFYRSCDDSPSFSRP